MTAETLESRYRVSGMDCAGCGRKIDTALRRLPGVEDVSVAVQTGALRVRHGGGLTDEAVLQQLRNLGYDGEAVRQTAGSVQASADPAPPCRPERHRLDREALRRGRHRQNFCGTSAK